MSAHRDETLEQLESSLLAAGAVVARAREENEALRRERDDLLARLLSVRTVLEAVPREYAPEIANSPHPETAIAKAVMTLYYRTGKNLREAQAALESKPCRVEMTVQTTSQHVTAALEQLLAAATSAAAEKAQTP